MLTEKEVSDHVYKLIQEGRANRANGTPNKYAADTLGHLMGCVGFVYEDLRLALMKKDESYCFGQAVFEQSKAKR